MNHENKIIFSSVCLCVCPPTKYDLRGPVVARGDDGAVVFVVKGGAAEVHHPHRRALHRALISLLQGNKYTGVHTFNFRCVQGQTVDIGAVPNPEPLGSLTATRPALFVRIHVGAFMTSLVVVGAKGDKVIKISSCNASQAAAAF